MVGLSELIHAVWIGLIKPKAKPKKILLCVLCGDFADLQLRVAYEEILWHGSTYADELVGIDLTTDEFVKERCFEFAKQHQIKLIKKDYLSKINITEL